MQQRKYIVGISHCSPDQLRMWREQPAHDKGVIRNQVDQFVTDNFHDSYYRGDSHALPKPIFRRENEVIAPHSNQPRWHEVVEGKSKEIVMGPYQRSYSYKLLNGFTWKDQKVTKGQFSLPAWSGSPIFFSNVFEFKEEWEHYEYPDSTIIAECERANKYSLGQVTVDFQHEIDKLMIACIAKARRSAYDIATEIAEGRETLRFFADVLRKAIQLLRQLFYLWRAIRDPSKVMPAYRRYLRRQWRRGKRSLKWHGSYGIASEQAYAMSRYWLMYRYAVVPLMYSIRDFCKARHLRGTVYQKFHTSGNINDTASYDYTNHTITTERNVRVRCTIRQRVESSEIHSKYAFWVPTALWEIVPFSFVLDWFVNIGNLIQSFRPKVSVDDIGCVSVKTEVSTEALRYIEERNDVHPNFNDPDLVNDYINENIVYGWPYHYTRPKAEGVVVRVGRVHYKRVLASTDASQYATLATTQLWDSLIHEIDALALAYVTLGKKVVTPLVEKRQAPVRVSLTIDRIQAYRAFRRRIRKGARRK